MCFVIILISTIIKYFLAGLLIADLFLLFVAWIFLIKRFILCVVNVIGIIGLLWCFRMGWNLMVNYYYFLLIILFYLASILIPSTFLSSQPNSNPATFHNPHNKNIYHHYPYLLYLLIYMNNPIDLMICIFISSFSHIYAASLPSHLLLY